MTSQLSSHVLPSTSGSGATKEQQQQQQEQQAGSAASDQAQNFYNTFKAGYEQVKSKAAGAAGGGSGQEPAAKRLLQTLAQDLREVLLPAQDITSATRAYTGPVASAAYDGPTALVLSRQQATGWQKAWNTMQEKLSGVPLVNKIFNLKVTDTTAFKKGQELVEDLKDKYETSDHPVVHKVEDLKSRMFTGSEASRAMREIRARDPSFDMNRFVQMVKVDARPVVRAFLKHDLESLSQHCGPELLERFSGIFKHFDEQGVFEDPSILFIGDVEIVEQERSPVVTAEGKVLPPRWVIKDMMWQSMLALV
ncbi:hypothetical protein GPECTOR_9g584 [Gonium pectorale]|uniref:Tim44-like domain-containing protein n=1 Tax=Gonium pectorale TaxID=33097 RepID=A0A150GT78_GONPE|nr:hypothetical protein GPECTOR_9g584 [Gonium pectorale]|eukprot:KXZ52540.1 hypothetical protein GPECTOR_9g584 [Gonium pectorale]